MRTRGGSGSVLAGAGLLALTLVPLGQVFVLVGIVGGVLAAVVLAVGVKTADRGAVRLAAMTLLLALVGSIGLPFGIWFAVAAIWLCSRADPEIAPARGWLPAGTSSPVLWWLTGAIVLIAGFGLTIWSQVVSEPAQGATGQLIEAARAVPGWAVALFVIIFVPVNAVTEEVAYRGIAFETAATFLPPIPGNSGSGGRLRHPPRGGFPVRTGRGWVDLRVRIGNRGHARGSGGLRFPVLAHMAADATIAVLVIVLLFPG